MPTVRSSYTDSLNFYGATSPQELIARYGSPLYVYNEAVLRQRCRELTALSTFPGFRVNYSAKANTNIALLKIIREQGLLVDAMSPGELHMNLLAGFAPEEILYVCNNVSADELRIPIEKNILVSVDSLAQLDVYGQINPGGRVMVRLNPGKGAGHHKKVVTAGKETKFGIDPADIEEMRALLTRYKLKLVGINQHIGSLFMNPEGYLETMNILLGLATQFELELIDFGGGFGIPYRKYEHEPRLDFTMLGLRMDAMLKNWAAAHSYTGRFLVEPGRYVVAECGVLLGTVHATKNNGSTLYAGTDIGFNVLARPMLYDAYHDVEIYREHTQPDSDLYAQTIVGNICESGDILAKDRLLPRMQQGDIVGMLDAGAYGFVMSSSYNQRPRPAEVLVQTDGSVRCIRRRETLEDLTRFFV